MKNKGGNIFIVIGLVLIGSALIITFNNIRENIVAEKSSRETVSCLKEQIYNGEISPYTGDENNEPLYKQYSDMTMPEIEIDGERYIGILSIPDLDLELPVRGDFSYKGLTTAPCRYSGSIYKDDMIIAGHNYAAHFGYLNRLDPDGEVSFTDGDGNEFNYRLREIVQLNETDTEEMVEGDWDLTLFTCNLSGRNRITLRFDRISK